MSIRTQRYDRVARLLHWLIGVALIAQMAFGFVLDDIAPRGTSSRAVVINLHKSVGIALAVLIALRIVWRLRHRPAAWSASMSASERRAARIGHAALYVCMAVMPLSGYGASNFSRHGIRLFGLALRPWGPDWPAVYATLNLVHVTTAWLFAALIAGHVLFALKHALADRDRRLARVATPAAP